MSGSGRSQRSYRFAQLQGIFWTITASTTPVGRIKLDSNNE